MTLPRDIKCFSFYHVSAYHVEKYSKYKLQTLMRAILLYIYTTFPVRFLKKIQSSI